ncbi:MAG: methyltransferase type 11 [Caulobacterales bacterium 68-7]|nr:MAG: methyltransferase type 11 [Caulobacterales bacterium 68-7]
MNMIFRQVSDQNPDSLATRFRRARAKRVVEVIGKIAAEKGSVRILDLGGDPGYWDRLFDRAFLEASSVHVTTVNPHVWERSADPMFELIEGDACDLPNFADDSFDLTHSNSVIEHVGDWKKMEAFARESRRLAPRYYVQTPYFWFPIEPHFSAVGFQWMPEQMRAKALLKRKHGWSDKAEDMGAAMRDVQDARLLDKAQFRFLFPDAAYPDETVAGFTKSLVAIRS